MNLIDHVINEHSLMFPDLLLLAMASSIMLEQTVMFSDIPSYTQQYRSGGVKGRFRITSSTFKTFQNSGQWVVL